MIYNQINLDVAKVADSKGYRDELKGVFFTDIKTVATNGMSLLEVYVPQDLKVEDVKGAMRGVKPFIASAEMVKGIKAETLAVKHLHQNRIEFLQGENIVNVKRIEAKFPDYEQIFPLGAPVARVNVNAKMLISLLEVLAKINKNEVQLQFYRDDKPLVLEADSGNQEGRGLLAVMKVQ